MEIQNPARALRPGTFARAEVQLDHSGAPVLAVPQLAVQEIGLRTVVFVPGSAPGEFRATAVEIGEPLPDGRVRVLAGLTAGTRIVVEGCVPASFRARQRRELDAQLGSPGRPAADAVAIPPTPGEKQLIQKAAAEARQRNDDFMGTEHLLLALLREAGSPTAQVFSRHGVTFEIAVTHLH
ncbi:MAG: Clp protease N-terminal domain-containing protein [Longimicrobiales bacterium]